MTVRLIEGDALEVLPTLDAESIGAVVTDPPYDLTSGNGRGFMSKRWDGTGIAFRPEFWAAVLRTMKPGAHLVAFGGTRTYHRMACAIEDAGFEIRDSIHWIYGSGFPKSLDVSKAIDKGAGVEREVIGWTDPSDPRQSGCNGHSGASLAGSVDGRLNRGSPIPITAPATDAARQWQGWGTALKPAHEPIILARKPLAPGLTIAANVLKYGTGALNVDGCRIGLNGEQPPSGSGDMRGRTVYAQDEWTQTKMDNGGNVTPASGRFPPNAAFVHHPDCEPCGERRVKGGGHHPARRNGSSMWAGGGGGLNGNSGPERYMADPDGLETVPAFRCVDGCPVALLDAQSGERPGMPSTTRRKDSQVERIVYGLGLGAGDAAMFPGYGDTGGASRFFPTFQWTDADFAPFLYCPKASRRDRGEGNTHATVKPLNLMKWLCKLIAPPGLPILDPFAGSGTTGVAAEAEGFDAVLIERESEYCEIIRNRLAAARARQPLFAASTP